jgi:hypothetical protein
MIVALILLTHLERNVRINLKNSNGSGDERVKIIGQLYINKPTGKNIIETLENIAVILIFDEESG